MRTNMCILDHGAYNAINRTYTILCVQYLQGSHFCDGVTIWPSLKTILSIPSTEGAAMKIQDRKMRDQMSGRENTGSEFGGLDEGSGKCRAGK